MYSNLKNLIPTKIFLKLKFLKKIGGFLNFKNPKSFNEKINYLKIYDDQNIKSDLQDKLKVKNYVSSIIGEEYIIETLKILDINVPFEEQLRKFDKFILKTNFESGIVYFCEDIEKFEFKKIQSQIINSYNKNFHMHGREMHYSRIEKNTFAEKLLENHKELIDYKFYCFDGIPMYVHVDRERYTDHKRSIYTAQWEKIENLTIEYKYDPIYLSEPFEFEKMKNIASELSKNFKFVRIDLYNHNKKILFGEMTFYPGSGFEKFSIKNFDYEFGKLIKI